MKKYLETVSVIIPVYNAEKYIDRCILSVVNQTHIDLEIIIINDGSTDNSLKICKEWEQKDNRIKVLNKRNTGVADTRNYGLNIAKGKYISFVDSDDFIEPNMYSEMIKLMKQNNSELCMCNFYIIDEIQKKPFIYSTIENADKHTILKLVSESNNGITVWGKLFIRNIIGNIKFDTNISISEDVLFFYQYVDKIEKISNVKEPLYNYNIGNPNSLSKMNSKNYITSIKAYYSINKILEKNNINCRYNKQANSVCNYAIHKKNIGEDYDYSEYDRIIQEYMDNGLLYKVKGFKNKIKVFLAYYMKSIYLFLKIKNNLE